MGYRFRSTVLLPCLLAIFAGMGPAHAHEPVLHPFKNKLIRPVPGYTVACRYELLAADRRVTIDGDVTVVEADRDGALLRYLRQDGDGRSIEVSQRFDIHGGRRGEPTVRQAGEVARQKYAVHLARSFAKSVEHGVYAGYPVSSGDTFVTPLTPEEAQALAFGVLPSRARVMEWFEVGHVAGAYRHRKYGEVVVVERGIRGTVNVKGKTAYLTIRTKEHYDLTSGLLVVNDARATWKYEGVPRVVRMDLESDCEYVVTP